MAFPYFVGRDGRIGMPETSRHFRCQDAPTGLRLQPKASSGIDLVNRIG
jgi:hypothetical protein